MNDNLDNDIKNVEDQLKELINKKKEIIIKDAEEKLLNKYLKADGIIMKIKSISHVVNQSTVHVKVYAVASTGDELMICDNYPIDLDFEKNQFEESSEEDFNNSIKTVVDKLNLTSYENIN